MTLPIGRNDRGSLKASRSPRGRGQYGGRRSTLPGESEKLIALDGVNVAADIDGESGHWANAHFDEPGLEVLSRRRELCDGIAPLIRQVQVAIRTDGDYERVVAARRLLEWPDAKDAA